MRMANERPEDAPLNPDIKRRFDETYDKSWTQPPLATTHAHEGAQGEGWPWVWLVITLICVALAVYFLI